MRLRAGLDGRSEEVIVIFFFLHQNGPTNCQRRDFGVGEPKFIINNHLFSVRTKIIQNSGRQHDEMNLTESFSFDVRI